MNQKNVAIKFREALRVARKEAQEKQHEISLLRAAVRAIESAPCFFVPVASAKLEQGCCYIIRRTWLNKPPSDPVINRWDNGWKQAFAGELGARIPTTTGSYGGLEVYSYEGKKKHGKDQKRRSGKSKKAAGGSAKTAAGSHKR